MYPFLQSLHIDYNIDIFVRRLSWRFTTSCHRTMFCRSRERLNKGINNACLDLTKFSLDPLMKTKKRTRVFLMWILHMLISTTTSLREILNSCFLISCFILTVTSNYDIYVNQKKHFYLIHWHITIVFLMLYVQNV